MRLSRLKLMATSALQAAVLPLSNLLITTLGILRFNDANWGYYIEIQLWIIPLILLSNWGSRNYLIEVFSQKPATVAPEFLKNLCGRLILLPSAVVLLLFVPSNIAIWALLVILTQYIYLSYDGVTVFKERYKDRIIAEITGTIAFLVGLLFMPEFELQQLLMLQFASSLIKLMYMSVRLRDLKLWQGPLVFSLGETLKKGFPFLMIGFSGWLQSKSDLYMLSFLKGTSEIASYQLFIGGILVLHSAVSFMLDPLVKFIYRSKSSITFQISRFVLRTGLPMVILGLVLMSIGLQWLVPNKFGIESYIYGLSCLIPFLIYSPHIFSIYKAGQHQMMVKINIMGAIINGVVSWLLIPTMGVNGAILGTALSQVAVLPFILLAARKYLKP